jgi:hypothetical protein
MEFSCKGTTIDLYQRPFIVILGEQIVKSAVFTAILQRYPTHHAT